MGVSLIVFAPVLLLMLIFKTLSFVFRF